MSRMAIPPFGSSVEELPAFYRSYRPLAVLEGNKT